MCLQGGFRELACLWALLSPPVGHFGNSGVAGSLCLASSAQLRLCQEPGAGYCFAFIPHGCQQVRLCTETHNLTWLALAELLKLLDAVYVPDSSQ